MSSVTLSPFSVSVSLSGRHSLFLFHHDRPRSRGGSRPSPCACCLVSLCGKAQQQPTLCVCVLPNLPHPCLFLHSCPPLSPFPALFFCCRITPASAFLGGWAAGGGVASGANGGTECAVCTIGVGLVEQFAELHNKTASEALAEICKLLPSKLQQPCTEFVDLAGPCASPRGRGARDRMEGYREMSTRFRALACAKEGEK